MANVLNDDGVCYGDFLEQITYLLFLKMADEMNNPPFGKKSSITITNNEGEVEREELNYNLHTGLRFLPEFFMPMV